MYISFEDYIDIGGAITDEATFAPLEVKARRIVNRRTQGRLEKFEYDEIPEEVKLCMADLIDELSEDKEDEAISSYSNDGVSVTYAQPKTAEQRMYQILEDILPPELLFRGIDNE